MLFKSEEQKKTDAIKRITDEFLEALVFADREKGSEAEISDVLFQTAKTFVTMFVEKEWGLVNSYQELLATGANIRPFGHNLYYSVKGHGTGFFDDFEGVPLMHLDDAIGCANFYGEIYEEDGFIYPDGWTYYKK